jgi:hypothetical protein
MAPKPRENAITNACSSKSEAWNLLLSTKKKVYRTATNHKSSQWKHTHYRV